MNITRLSYSVLFWHYRRGLSDLFHIWMNFLTLVYRVFSLPDLFKTFFSPWRRLKESYNDGPGVDFEQIAGALVTNTMMRLVGAFVRTIFIVLSLAIMAFVLVAGLFVLLVWLLMPLVLVGSFVLGVGLLFW